MFLNTFWTPRNLSEADPIGKNTTLATSIDFLCARVGYAEATESGCPDLIVKTYEFGTTDEVFASQDRVCAGGR